MGKALGELQTPLFTGKILGNRSAKLSTLVRSATIVQFCHSSTEIGIGTTSHVQAVVEWLSPLDFNQKQEDVLAKTESNTGQWLLDNENYKIWGNGASGTLWCHGIRKGNPLCPILFAFPWTDVTW